MIVADAFDVTGPLPSSRRIGLQQDGRIRAGFFCISAAEM
jgi:hypothetical protein